VIASRIQNPESARYSRFIQTDDGSHAFCYDADYENASRSSAFKLAPAVADFISGVVEVEPDGGSPVAIKFILPKVNGYVARSDFLERRLDGVEHVAKVTGFLAPRQAVTVPSVAETAAKDLSNLLSSAVGAVLLERGDQINQDEMLTILEDELRNRISFPWVVPIPIAQKRLVWVEGRKDADVSRRMYEAAMALGITLVVIDNSGHWLQDDHGPYAYLREAFIPVNIDVDEKFVDRLVAAVRS
jgi:pimeloyl-ACP methyl ester carboxylesterase